MTAAQRMTAARRWREQLLAWAIPEEYLAAVRESPWQFPVAAMARRTEVQLANPTGESYARAAEALAEPGTVLDVGAAAGAASLPLAGRVTELTAVDEQPSMMDALVARADALSVPVRTIAGRWPDVAASVSTVDVVVCHHVVYNVPDLADFVRALDGHARRRVVVELTDRHPMHVLNAYWRRMHGLVRPEGPSYVDAVAVLREVGLSPQVVRWRRPRTPQPVEEYLRTTARAVCVPPERLDELAGVIADEGGEPPDRGVVTLWWDTLGREDPQPVPR